MRSSRLRKFKRKYRVFGLIVQIVMIWYLVLFATSYLTTDTAAEFWNKEDTSGNVTAGYWYKEKYALRFTDKGNQNLDACKAITIKTKLINDGPDAMKEPSTYEVYYIANGNPKHGEKLSLADGEGIIKPLKTGESTELKFKASQPGRYIFLAYQQAEDDENPLEIWSKEIKVDCDSGQKPKEKQQETNEVIKEEVTEQPQKEEQQSEEAAQPTEETEVIKEEEKAETVPEEAPEAPVEKAEDAENTNAAKQAEESSDTDKSNETKEATVVDESLTEEEGK